MASMTTFVYVKTFEISRLEATVFKQFVNVLNQIYLSIWAVLVWYEVVIVVEWMRKKIVFAALNGIFIS